MEQIEPGIFKYESRPAFVQWPKESGCWLVWGSETKLAIGEVAEIYQYSSNEIQPVEILEHVAERLVLKRDGTRVRFVLATFDKIVEEN